MKSLLPDAFQGVEMNLCSPLWLGVSADLLNLLPLLCGATEELRVRAGHLTLTVFEGRLLTQVHFEKGLLAYS